MQTPSGSTSSLTLSVEDVMRHSVCFAGVCVPEETLRAAVVMLFGLVALLVMVGLAHVHRGREALETERERTRAEQRAFREFAIAIEGIELQNDERRGPQAGVGAGTRGADPPVGLLPKPPDGGVQAVREAYRETVMAVDHYEEEYGESLATNVAAELSPEVAAALVDGGPLTPQLKQALVEQSTQAAERRDDLLDAIDEEEAALARAASRLDDLKERVADLESAAFLPWNYTRLQDAFGEIRGVQADIDDLVERRQETVRASPIPGDWVDGDEFRTFLYEPLDVSHPVLADAADLLDRAEAVEHDVVRSLLRRT